MLPLRLRADYLLSLYFLQPQLRPDWLTNLLNDLGQAHQPLLTADRWRAAQKDPHRRQDHPVRHGAGPWPGPATRRPPGPAPVPPLENRPPARPGPAPGAICRPLPGPTFTCRIPGRQSARGMILARCSSGPASPKSARLRASSTWNGPTSRRRKAVRCAPQPRAAPRSAARVRM